MQTPLSSLPLALTFDDVLLLPGYADFSRGDIDLSVQLTPKITITLPFISAPMDTVTESAMAIALGELGGLGIIHRNLTVDDQADEVQKVKDHSTHSGQDIVVGAAVGTGKGFEDRVAALVKAGVAIVVVDSADGYKKPIIDATKFIKQTYPSVAVMAGNIATYDGAKALIEAGADMLRVGMGPGAICTTRVITGMGVPQITAIQETVRAARSTSSGRAIPVIADGGIKYSGDMTKALAAGAHAVMMGGYFASAKESPGETVMLDKSQVPQRFLSIFNHTHTTFMFKQYRGMGSIGAMQKGAEIKSEGEFHGKDYKDRVLVAEGVEGLVPVKGTVRDLIDQAAGGIKSGMYHVGAKTIKELWEKASFIQITQASLTESHPHDILITNPGENYV